MVVGSGPVGFYLGIRILQERPISHRKLANLGRADENHPR
jgi:hypothetical protein